MILLFTCRKKETRNGLKTQNLDSKFSKRQIQCNPNKYYGSVWIELIVAETEN